MVDFQSLSRGLAQYFVGIYGGISIGYLFSYLTGLWIFLFTFLIISVLLCFKWRKNKYDKKVLTEFWYANGALWLNWFALVVALVFYFVD